MANLAEVGDIEDRIGRQITDLDEVAQLEALLADVSATIRSYTGRPFESTTATRRLRVRCGVVDLGRDDVTAVSTVETIEGTEIDGTWDGMRRVAVGSVNRFDLDTIGATFVDVTYTYGDATVPADIMAVACQVVGRAFGRPADETGLSSESVEGYSYSVGAAAAAGPAGFLADEKAVLDRHKAVGGTAWIGRG